MTSRQTCMQREPVQREDGFVTCIIIIIIIIIQHTVVVVVVVIRRIGRSLCKHRHPYTTAKITTGKLQQHHHLTARSPLRRCLGASRTTLYFTTFPCFIGLINWRTHEIKIDLNIFEELFIIKQTVEDITPECTSESSTVSQKLHICTCCYAEQKYCWLGACLFQAF